MAVFKKPQQKHSRADELMFEPEDMRWATPEIVAQYRAERLRCGVIADLGCGIGFQSFAFASVCKKVFAVEKDARKVELAQKNAKILGIRNIEFITGDILSSEVVERLKKEKVEVVFCDPERLSGEEERKVESIIPDIPQLLKLYSPISNKIAIEFPPQIKNMPTDCEQEYLSVEGQLNRLTLYFGELKQCERSVMLLPSGVRLINDNSAKLVETEKLGKYLYEIDPAITKARLLSEVCKETSTALYSQGKATYFTSDEKVESLLFKNKFLVLVEVGFNKKEILEALQAKGIGKVILRYGLEPVEYWEERNYYERKLKGEKKGYLFQLKEKAVIGELMG